MAIFIYLVLISGIVLILMGMRLGERARMPQMHKAKHSFLSRIFPFTPGILERLRLDLPLKYKLDSSHVKFSPQEFFNLKILTAIFLLAAVLVILGRALPIMYVVAAVLGYILPDFWLASRTKQRRYRIARCLPETVDLLGLCVEAGLEFTSAVKWIVEKIPSNPMIEELAFVVEEIRWGKQRAQALKDMAKRLNIPEVSSFVQTLVQAERMGTPVADAFAILSEDTRLQRFHRGERVAMQAPIKILIPLIFCILPVIAIIIGGPIFLQFMQGGLLGGFGK